MEAGNQPPEVIAHAAETLRPLDETSSTLAPHWPQPSLPAPTRRSRLRAHPLLLLTLSLILILAGGGSALAAVKGFTGRSIGGSTGVQLASATATATNFTHRDTFANQCPHGHSPRACAAEG